MFKKNAAYFMSKYVIVTHFKFVDRRPKDNKNHLKTAVNN